MHIGLPVVCSDFTLWKNIVDKYKCGIYVNPNSTKEIKNAINYLILNKEKAYEMGQNGISAVKEEFNWNSQEERLLSVYRNILK